MNRLRYIYLFCLCVIGLMPLCAEDLHMGIAQQWHLHLSYRDPQMIAASNTRIYAISNGSLFAYDRNEEQLVYMSKETGLNGSSATQIAYDTPSKQLIIAYEDGRIDLLDDNDNVRQMPDIHMKGGTSSVAINAISTGKKAAYLSMSFGIVAINAKKAEVADTYYIGENAAYVDVRQVVELHDSLYAFTDGYMYRAALKDNLVDYSYWSKSPLPDGKLMGALAQHDQLHVQVDSIIYRLDNQEWKPLNQTKFRWMHASEGHLMAATPGFGLYEIADDGALTLLTNKYLASDALYSRGECWMGEINWGLIHLSKQGDYIYHPEGPNSNFGYAMTTAHGRLYSTIGGRWAVQYWRLAKINIYDGMEWKTIHSDDIYYTLGYTFWDPVSIAVDPQDPGHFFVASYGTGMYEFRDYAPYKRYGYQVTTDTWNCTLRSANATATPVNYTRVDGMMIDENSNVWMLNATSVGQPVHVMTPDGKWYGLPLKISGEPLVMHTPTGIWVDKRNKNRKWFMDQRDTPGVILLDDNGTPTNASDDRCMKRNTFVDQNGNAIVLDQIYCFAQDLTNRIWIGTPHGPILLDAKTEFFTSNACRRIIIPRNDGTGLGDYLLGDERINCMAADGGNRMWIGTATSGLYLIEDDTITVAHFTQDNSVLPSNTIQSIAIEPTTGDVYVGTDKGIASYRSDASEARTDMSGVYAYPNPVRPDYGGNITIVGLMDNTVVNIVDAGGNLVCKTRSHGGTAVWDGRDAYGNRATPGVYTALCNADGGHAAVKILFIR